LALLELVRVEAIDEAKLVAALLDQGFEDLEDFLQDKCATDVKAEYVVTRNPKDFAFSQTPSIAPKSLLEILDKA
jgi:hypothetical protein